MNNLEEKSLAALLFEKAVGERDEAVAILKDIVNGVENDRSCRLPVGSISQIRRFLNSIKGA